MSGGNETYDKKGHGMKKQASGLAILLLGSTVALCTTAYAWGPKADTAIVIASSNQLMRSANVPLKSFTKELQAGASLPHSSMLELFPNMDTDAVSAIETEMSLLQSVRGDQMDPYYVYRLGVLGKLVATATTPMQGATAAFRDLYFADVELNIESISLAPKERRVVSPRDYFRDMMTLANQNNELIERAYRGGEGFKGVPAASLPDHSGRSVDAVTDVWNTLLASKSVGSGISEDQKERYVLDAYRFYIARGNMGEIDAAVARLEKVTAVTTPMRVQIAGYFYDAKKFDRAIQEYETVLAEDPLQKEAQERIAEYYLMKGDEALDAEKYEDALKFFGQAADANPLNSRGEEMRLHTEGLIGMRNSNYETLKGELTAASQKVDLAEEEARNHHYAEAIALLGEAVETYSAVGDDFPDLAQEKLIKVRRVSQRMEELRQGMMQNVSSFSGMGYSVDINAMAKTLTGDLEQKGLQQVIKSELDKELEALEAKMAGSFKIE